jgi:RNA polymerase primary sigma factor
MRFGLGVDAEHTLAEIGEKLGVSRERIRQIEVSALRKLRRSEKLRELRTFLKQ